MPATSPFEGDDKPSWVTFEGQAFDQSNLFQQGPLSEEAVQKVVTDNLDECIGYAYCSNYPEYRFVVKRGTVKMPQAGWTCKVYKVRLPKEEDPFCDDFAGKPASLGSKSNLAVGWARPGRGQGLGDTLQDLEMIQGVDPNDLRQGGLGDCWLLSAFSAMCEFPQAVRAMVSPHTLSAKGKYTVSLHDYSQKKVVQLEVDDRIPKGQYGRPAFTDFTEDGEMWPCILEKAVAMMAGTYDNIDGGDPLFALGMLTGAPAENLVQFRQGPGNKWTFIKPDFKSPNPHDASNTYLYGNWPEDNTPGDQAKDASVVTKLLGEYDLKNYLMCAGTHAGSDKDVSSFGIVQGHAYTILQVVLNVAGTGKNLLQLRNPWGTGEWTGDWSDQSDLWKQYPKVKEALDYEAADDGIFWIEDKDFYVNYSQVVACCKDMGKNRTKTEKEAKKALAGKPKDPAVSKVPQLIKPKRGENKIMEAKRLKKKIGGGTPWVRNPDFNRPITLQKDVEAPISSPHASTYTMSSFFKRYYGDMPQAPHAAKFKPDPKAWYQHTLVVSFPDPAKAKKGPKAKAKVKAMPK